MGDKIKRNQLAHYVNAATSGLAKVWTLLGIDLEEFNIELNGNIETKKNILGNTTVALDSYEPQMSVEPYYSREGDPLFTRLWKIANERQTLDDLVTGTLEVNLGVLISAGVYEAYYEDAIFEVVSYGGDTTGLQIPFNLHNTGNRVKGQFTVATKTFVADTGALGLLVIEVIKGGTTTSTKVTDVIGEGAGSLMYKVGASVTEPYYGEASTGYTALTIGTAITTATGQYIVVVEVNTTVVAASAVTRVVVGA